MRYRKSIFILFLILCFTNIKAQNFELGKVSIAELQEKKHPKDTSAVAAVLFKKGEVKLEFSTDSGFDLFTQVAMRIKIYKKEGFDWATQIVNFGSGTSSRETVNFTDVVTYNLVNGKIEKTKLKNEGEFEKSINNYWSQKKITMPNVKEGSVIEFRYTIKSATIGVLRDWDFQTSIPVNYVEYKTYIPEYFIYNTNQKGFIFPKISIEKKQVSVSVNGVSDKDGTVSSSIFSKGKLDYQEIKTTYIAENLPAMAEEVFVNNISNYTSSLSQELGMTHYPNEPLKPFSSDWNSLVKTIYEYNDFGAELNKSNYFEEDLKPILLNLTTNEAKINAVFDFVKASMRWNDTYNYFCNDGVKKAYKDKVGNVAEINLMLTAMLRYAGVTANPVLVSTRSNGIAIFPNSSAFNYIIVAVESSNGLVLLDATDKYSIPNVLPFRALNWVGRLIRKDGTSEEVDLMPKVASNDIIVMNYSIETDGKIIGKLRRQRTDYNAMIFRKNIEDVKEEAYLEKLENDDDKIEISEYLRANEKDFKLPISEIFAYKGSDLCEIIGGKIYLNPLLFYTQVENPFKQENREYPVDYGFPFIDKYIINIQIPDGYKIETLPASAILTMEDDLGVFKFITHQMNNTIQISVISQINTAIISSEYYVMLKDFYQKMIDKQNEKIILTKI
jgi:Domain of Unknown Function with PDB structure (DUF3857)